MIRSCPSHFAACLLIVLASAAGPVIVAKGVRPPVVPGTPAPAADIPISFTLEKPGWVTLVLDDANGVRAANLVQDTWFDAGRHTIYWDGMDIGQPYERKGWIGGYAIQHTRMAPGQYHLHGLVHGPIGLTYELSVNAPGTPPWFTDDGSGAWMADHTPPLDALFLPDGSPHGNQPQILLSSSIAEAGHSAIWVTEDGRKLFGGRLYGGRGGMANCRDSGPQKDSTFYAYCALMDRDGVAVWGLNSAARAQANGQDSVKLASLPATVFTHEMRGAYGLAAFNGTLVLSLPQQKMVAFIGRRNGLYTVISTEDAPDPRGVLFDGRGRLYLISKQQVLRYQPDLKAGKLGNAETVIKAGLEDAHRGVFDAQANLYVSDWGTSHQVKVFNPEGRLIRSIGHPGGPVIGPYDEQRMHQPCGMAIDSRGQLWVTEDDYCPKRVSLWTTDGKFLRAFYGPPAYGGDGCLDPRDKTRLYYAAQKDGIEFQIDWQTGESKPRTIYAYGDSTAMADSAPMNALYLGGRQYMVNNQGRSATTAGDELGIWIMEKNGIVRRVAALGFASHAADKRWDALNTPEMEKKADAVTGKGFLSEPFYQWTDSNGDGKITPDEVQFISMPKADGPMRINADLSISCASTLMLPAPKIRQDGVPVYDLKQARFLGGATKRNGRSLPKGLGRGDIVTGTADGGWLIGAFGPLQGLRETDGKVIWTYKDQYPNRSLGTPSPRYPGESIATATFLGAAAHPAAGEAREFFALNGDRGQIYLMTTDGLFLTALGGDCRTYPAWTMPMLQRGAPLGHVSFGAEMFHPSMTQMEDGSIYLVVGQGHASVLELGGLETVRRLDFGGVDIPADGLARKPDSYIEPVYQPQERSITVPIRATPPVVDGKLIDWKPGDFVSLDPALGLEAACQVSGDRLYLAYRVGDPARLSNTGGDGWQHLFSSGEGLDLMLRTRPDLPDKGLRTPFYLPNNPFEGDIRVVVSRAGEPQTGRVVAVRFQEVGNAGMGEPVLYQSPIGQAQFSSVADISKQIAFAQVGGDYEVAIPLSILGLTPKDGTITRGDLGILIGAGGQAQSRHYFGQGSSGQIADVPSEARLDARGWATWTFKKE